MPLATALVDRWHKMHFVEHRQAWPQTCQQGIRISQRGSVRHALEIEEARIGHIPIQRQLSRQGGFSDLTRADQSNYRRSVESGEQQIEAANEHYSCKSGFTWMICRVLERRHIVHCASRECEPAGAC